MRPAAPGTDRTAAAARSAGRSPGPATAGRRGSAGTGRVPRAAAAPGRPGRRAARGARAGGRARPTRCPTRCAGATPLCHDSAPRAPQCPRMAAAAPDASWTLEPGALALVAIVGYAYLRRWRAVRAEAGTLAL